MMKKREETNHYDLDILMENTLRKTRIGHRYYGELCTVLKKVAMLGQPAEFYFNEFGIKYNVKDEFGVFRLTWIVTNKLSGKQKIFYTKDWVGTSGRVRWRNLSSAMRKV